MLMGYAMEKVVNPFDSNDFLVLPDNTFIAKMKNPVRLQDVRMQIMKSLENPIGTKSLSVIASEKTRCNPQAKAVIVVSDNTRPVPYKGEEGILMPIICTLMSSGFSTSSITVVIATGTHKAMSEGQIHEMIDEEVFSLGIKVVNHDSKDVDNLTKIGLTSRGTRVTVNSIYMQADLKILTGLVESHFMAGVSGGRKSVCPGIIGEESTYVFHGPEFMESDEARNMNLFGNPVHEESLEIAHLAGVDFIVNVTLDSDFHVTGVFSGDLDSAHLAAVEKLKESVCVKVPYMADVVITHAGYVGINHYQCAKCAVAALEIVKENGSLIILSNTTDRLDPVGNITYRVCLSLLHLIGVEKFSSLIKSPDWTFVPDQWEVQQWGKVLKRIPEENLFLYSPLFRKKDFEIIPGIDASALIHTCCDASYQKAIDSSLSIISKREGKAIEDLRIVYLEDGPYEVPFL